LSFDLIMNGDFNIVLCPWNVFQQVWKAFNHQIPLSQINAYFRDHLTRMPPAGHVYDFSYFLWFWVGFITMAGLPSMAFVPGM
jgi:hypothetical protein